MNDDSRSFEEQLASLKVDVAVLRSNYVTKAELQEVRGELKAEIQALRTELKAEIQTLRDEMQKMRIEFHKELHAQTWRLYGFGLVLVAAVHILNRYGY